MYVLKKYISNSVCIHKKDLPKRRRKFCKIANIAEINT